VKKGVVIVIPDSMSAIVDNVGLQTFGVATRCVFEVHRIGKGLVNLHILLLPDDGAACILGSLIVGSHGVGLYRLISDVKGWSC